jgi:type III secretion system chaperone SycN
MRAPSWIESAVTEFGRAAGLAEFDLGDRGTAAISFNNGVSLRFEYAQESLVVATSIPARLEAESAARLLSYAHPNARLGFRMRTGYLARSGRAFFAVQLAGRDVTVPAINSAFAALWRIALEFGGVS